MNNCPDPDCRMSMFQIQPFSSKIMLRQLRNQCILHSCDECTTIDPIVDAILKQGKIVQGPGQDAAVELYLKASQKLAKDNIFPGLNMDVIGQK